MTDEPTPRLNPCACCGSRPLMREVLGMHGVACTNEDCPHCHRVLLYQPRKAWAADTWNALNPRPPARQAAR